MDSVQKGYHWTIGQLESSRRYGYPRVLKNRSQHWDTALLATSVKIAQNEQNRAKDYSISRAADKKKLTVMKGLSSKKEHDDGAWDCGGTCDGCKNCEICSRITQDYMALKELAPGNMIVASTPGMLDEIDSPKPRTACLFFDPQRHLD